MTLEEYIKISNLSQVEFGKMLGVTQSAIQDWLSDKIPVARVKQIEQMTAGQVSPYEMRPDVYPKNASWVRKSIMEAQGDE